MCSGICVRKTQISSLKSKDCCQSASFRRALLALVPTESQACSPWAIGGHREESEPAGVRCIQTVFLTGKEVTSAERAGRSLQSAVLRWGVVSRQMEKAVPTQRPSAGGPQQGVSEESREKAAMDICLL